MRSVFVLLTLLGASTSLAHIEMTAPTVRFNDGQNKWCPCGGGGGGQGNDGCEVSASDPNRGNTSTTFAPGETITVRWDETVNHSGRFRVSFDPDGADQTDFDAHILADIPDNATNNAGGNRWRVQVTLPTTPCNNCTLQLVQVMNGNTTDPVDSIFGTNTYFQCANLVIAGAEGEGEGEGDVGEGEGEGEGDVGEGEGEGDAGEGEGEGDVGEGEGEGQEGEGDTGEGEGEGEGEDEDGGWTCSSGAADASVASLALLTFALRRRRLRR